VYYRHRRASTRPQTTRYYTPRRREGVNVALSPTVSEFSRFAAVKKFFFPRDVGAVVRGIATVRYLSVRRSVRPSVTFTYRDRIG